MWADSLSSHPSSLPIDGYYRESDGQRSFVMDDSGEGGQEQDERRGSRRRRSSSQHDQGGVVVNVRMDG